MKAGQEAGKSTADLKEAVEEAGTNLKEGRAILAKVAKQGSMDFTPLVEAVAQQEKALIEGMRTITATIKGQTAPASQTERIEQAVEQMQLDLAAMKSSSQAADQSGKPKETPWILILTLLLSVMATSILATVVLRTPKVFVESKSSAPAPALNGSQRR